MWTIERSTMVQERVPLLALACRTWLIPRSAIAALPAAALRSLIRPPRYRPVRLALNADIVLQNPRADAPVPAEEYFVGLYETARLPTEVVVELRFPAARSCDRFGFVELVRRRGDFAIVGLLRRRNSKGSGIRSLRW